MKVTAVIKNVSEQFFTGFGTTIRGFDSLTDQEKLQYVLKPSDVGITTKIGSGQLRDRLELNAILRRGAYQVRYELGSRRGYKLATFEIVETAPNGQ